MSNNVNTKLYEEIAYWIDLPTHEYLVELMEESLENNDLEELSRLNKEAQDLQESQEEDYERQQRAMEKALRLETHLTPEDKEAIRNA